MSPNIQEMSGLIREQASRLGFFKAGITSVRPLPSAESFIQWLNKGFHGSMGYLQRQAPKRQDPGLVLAGARSMLVLAMNYHTEDGLTDEPLKGRISRYAWGDDYHKILMARLEELLRFIQKLDPSAEGLPYVDTGPVMEKVWGAQTTLGWMGKHTNLITRDHGSWFFVGVILLNIELAYDSKEKDLCGTCSRCLCTCPTGAIVAPYILDARLCVSYLTIELRGSIPRNLRPLIGNRIYGCDDCQEVCPWNRFAVKSNGSGFSPRPENFMPELNPLIRITPAEFKERFRNSPILRAKRDGFVRNVAVALGNSRKPEAIPVLAAACRDTSPLVRAHAAWALGQIGTREAFSILARGQSQESDPDVLEEIGVILQTARCE
jgi:epoxyqueuosine reductase